MKLPGLLSMLCGIEVEETISFAENQVNHVNFSLPLLNGNYSISTLADVIEPKGAEVVARFEHGFYMDKPAATINTYGSGKVVYLGFIGEPAFYNDLARWLSTNTGIDSSVKAQPGVEVVTRWQKEKKLIFLLNHTVCEKEVFLSDDFQELLSRKIISGKIIIPPLAIFILIDR
jgi:beta-galactosidase